MPLNLFPLLHLIDDSPAYIELINKLKKTNQASNRVLVMDSAKPYLIAAVYHKLQKPVLIITAQPENAKKLYEQLNQWCHSSAIYLFPEPDIIPYQRLIADFSILVKRQALS